LVIPTGFGKTAAVILAWLWKVRNEDPDTPRRLVYCLPMRTLVEQTEAAASGWLDALKLSDKVTLDVVMGGRERSRGAPDWIMRPEKPAILIGTQDLLVSAALMRAYGVTRYRWPVDFALLNNDAFWVFDEVQLTGATLATSAQLEAFRRPSQLRTARPSRTLWMSATLDPEWLRTVDFSQPGDWRSHDLSLADLDQARARFAARKDLSRLDIATEDAGKKAVIYAKALAGATLERHRRGRTTIVFLNTVRRAQAIFRALGAARPEAELLLVHSRFRPNERREQLARLARDVPAAGRIVVATQALEAGVDITSAVMITEIAPWSSLVQRFGRANRAGEENPAGAEILWIDLPDETSSPYASEDFREARAKLAGLPGCGPSDLAHIRPSAPERGQVIRRRDLLDLYDTDPDLAGFDIDISVYVREAEDTDVRVFWRPVEKERRTPEPSAPDAARDELCPAPIHGARDLVKRAGDRAWRWDALGKSWVTVKPADLYPGLVIWVDSTVGGYDPDLGFNPSAAGAVDALAGAAEQSEAIGDDPGSSPTPNQVLVSLAKHTERVVAHAATLAEALKLPSDERALLLETAAWHDWGKAHAAFVAKTPIARSHGQFLAKWPDADKPTEDQKKQQRGYFRHELASALGYLAVRGWARGADLAAYLIAAHHGKVRMRLRALPNEKPPMGDRLFARGVWHGDTLPAVKLGAIDAPQVTLDLDVMNLGDGANGPSWSARSQALLEEHGPFRLAWLEALLRIADWRASAEEGRLPDDDL
jgi:CRISPR-associated endonuclease/helicase Cas3